MKIGFLIISLICSASTFSQVSTFEKKGKFGINYEDQLIVKAKFDSVVIGHSEIATAFKKSKLYYFNQEGTKVYKSNIERAQVFKHGAGFICDKKGRQGAVDSNGDVFIEPSAFRELSYCNELIFLKDETYKATNKLYLGTKIIDKNVNSVKSFDHWVVASKSSSEVSYHTTKGGIFKKKKTTKTVSTTHWISVFDGISGKRLEKRADEVYKLDDFSIIKRNRSVDIYLERELFEDELDDFKEFNDSLYVGSKGDVLFLLTKKKKEKLLSGHHHDYKINHSTIYGLGHPLNSDLITIYDLNGNEIRKNLSYIYNISENKVVFSDSIGQFIGNDKGEKLSDCYDGFGTASEGIRKTFSGFTYGYINDSTYEDLGIVWPITGKTPYSSGRSRHRRGFIQTLGNSIRTFGRRIVGKPKVGNSVGYSSTTPESSFAILDEGHNFSDGMAIVCLNSLRRDAKYDTLYSFYESGAIYNYVTTSGKLMSTKKYQDCQPFINGLAWVKYNNYFYRINKSGKTVKSSRYNEVAPDEFGNFKVKKEGKWGVIDNNYKVLVPCSHAILDYKEGAYYSKYDGQEKLELRVSE